MYHACMHCNMFAICIENLQPHLQASLVCKMTERYLAATAQSGLLEEPQ